MRGTEGNLNLAINNREGTLNKEGDDQTRAAVRGLLQSGGKPAVKIVGAASAVSSAVQRAVSSGTPNSAVESPIIARGYLGQDLFSNGNLTDVQVKSALDALAGQKHFPDTVFKGLLGVLQHPDQYPWFGNSEYKLLFMTAVGAAVKERGNTLAPATYGVIRKVFLNLFDEADGFKTQGAVLDLFLNLSPQASADLMWEGINRLEKKYDLNGATAFSGEPAKTGPFFLDIKEREECHSGFAGNRA